MNTSELAWAAGFFDGEGTIFLAKRTNRGAPRYCVEVALSQRNPKPLDEFRRIVGEGTIKQHPSQGGIYRWRASSASACRVLALLSPYLVGKDEEARVAIEFQESRKRFANIPHSQDYEHAETVRKTLKGLKHLSRRPHNALAAG